MYCTKCGTQVSEGLLRCQSCGYKSEDNAAKEFYAYDYLTVEVAESRAAECMDQYEALGWKIMQRNQSFGFGKVTLTFRRDRKIKNKEQLLRQQAKLDDAVNGITVLERRKTSGAFTFALAFGILAALILGGGMCLCLLVEGAGPMAAGIVIGLTGIALCGVNYVLYRAMVRRAEKKITPLITQKREEIAVICEEAHRCLHS